MRGSAAPPQTEHLQLLRLKARELKGRSVTAAWIWLSVLLTQCLQAERNVEGIMDNSFLVEEAYNQEAGVVQHIFNAHYGLDRRRGADDWTWDLSFTQEWPVGGQRHQFSYTVPYHFVRSSGRTADGLGDVLLNYRYQALFDEATLQALAPRFSLVLPTGDEDRGLGEDTLGYQVNLPFSTAMGDLWFVHLNAGATFLPDAASAAERDLWHYQVGGSLIYAARSDLHFLVEWIGAWENELDSRNRLHHEFASLISPGLRKAFNLDNDLQIVVGAAAPVGLTSSAPDLGVFVYLSIEHPFTRAR